MGMSRSPEILSDGVLDVTGGRVEQKPQEADPTVHDGREDDQQQAGKTTRLVAHVRLTPRGARTRVREDFELWHPTGPRT